MAWDLATAKARLNIVGATQDTQVQAALDTAVAIAENYCGRKFTYAAEMASFYYLWGASLQLPRYPIEQVVSVTHTKNSQAITNYKVNRSAGLIEFAGFTGGEQIDVSYAGGYKTFPADLEYALWHLFDDTWPGMSGQGGGGSSAAAVESVTLADVGTVRFASGGAPTGGGVAALGLGKAFNILDAYVLWEA
jgi:hypothetical protein